jgi:hypothetical protein
LISFPSLTDFGTLTRQRLEKRDVMKVARLTGLSIFVGTILTLAGCNKSMPAEYGPLIPVQGKVTVAGKLLKGGNVNFYPLDPNVKDLQPVGVIDSEGNYFVSSYGQKGAPAGKYRVRVDPGSDDKELDMMVDGVYQDWQKSPLVVTVEQNAPANAYDLEIKVVKKR